MVFLNASIVIDDLNAGQIKLYKCSLLTYAILCLLIYYPSTGTLPTVIIKWLQMEKWTLCDQNAQTIISNLR